jgi:hypothetical protein
MPKAEFNLPCKKPVLAPLPPSPAILPRPEIAAPEAAPIELEAATSSMEEKDTTAQLAASSSAGASASASEAADSGTRTRTRTRGLSQSVEEMLETFPPDFAELWMLSHLYRRAPRAVNRAARANAASLS